MEPIPQRVVDRFLTIIDLGQDPGPCWLWPKSIGSHGYGQVGWQREDGTRTTTTAHRVAWVAAGHTLTPGMDVHHECFTNPCVNHHHLTEISPSENRRDNLQRTKTHCPQGHEYDQANTYVDPKGHRRCRACNRSRNRSQF